MMVMTFVSLMSTDVALLFILILTPIPACAAACCFPTRFSAILTEKQDVSTETGFDPDQNNRMDMIGGVRLFVDYEREEFAVFSDIHQRYAHFRIGRFMMLAPLDGPKCHAWHNVGQPLSTNLRPSMGFAVLLFQCPNPSVGFVNTFRTEHFEEWSLSGLKETEGKSNQLNQTTKARICMNTPGYTCEPNIHTTTYRERVVYPVMGRHSQPTYQIIDKLITRQWAFSNIHVPVKSDEDFAELLKLRTHFNICKQRRLRERLAQKLNYQKPHGTQASKVDGPGDGSSSSKPYPRLKRPASVKQLHSSQEYFHLLNDYPRLLARRQIDEEDESIVRRTVNLRAELRKKLLQHRRKGLRVVQKLDALPIW